MALPSLSDRVGGVVKLWNMDCRIVFSFKNSSNNLYYGTPSPKSPLSRYNVFMFKKYIEYLNTIRTTIGSRESCTVGDGRRPRGKAGL